MSLDIQPCNLHGKVCHLDCTYSLGIIISSELIWLQVAVQTFNLCKHAVEFSAGSPLVECCLELLLGLDSLHLLDTLHFALPLLPCVRDAGMLRRVLDAHLLTL